MTARTASMPSHGCSPELRREIDYDRSTGHGSTPDGFRLRIWYGTASGRHVAELRGPRDGLVCATGCSGVMPALDWADGEIRRERERWARG
ncbi:hypothetical protein [Plastoroseomonas hellenica]|uniref:hypothetical protein n=1 Tax=Plastoroseomonas hellenica TaxID=2687306 RepID=UPI001BAB8CB2|nr:hypothetical protein [Plastoroseomonas hellenica]MBR0644005.1 hypothetical protein [Plastoroseomonas hellenica]